MHAMKRLWMMFGVLLGSFMLARGQDEEVLEAAMQMTGAVSEEEADPSWVERLEAFRLYPLRINGSRSRLLSSGLLTPYQVAAIEDYRHTSGDILSPMELSLVDGFDSGIVKALGPCLSFSSGSLPGSVDTARVRQAALLGKAGSAFGGKYKAVADHFQSGAAWRSGDGTAHLVLEGRRNRILIGDFNVRYGQGVAHWSGFSMSSLSSLSAFSRRSTGLTPVWSYAGTGTHRGVAWEMVSRHGSASVFLDSEGFMGSHLEWMSRNGEAGFTVYRIDREPVFSADSRWNLRGTDLFAEVVWKKGTTAGRGGLLRPFGEHFRSGLLLRVIPSGFSGKKYGEYGLALGTEYLLRGVHSASWTVDAALLPVPETDPFRWQVRSVLTWDYAFRPGWSFSLRLTERFRSFEALRSEGRLDLHYGNAPWLSNFRFHVSCVRMPGFLSYWEGGVKSGPWTAWLRFTGIHIRSWPDRIWCYERDAPGNFSVPAYYGTGGGVSLYGGWKHRFRRLTLKCYLRAEGLWRKEKPGRTGLKMQVMLDL